MSTASPSEWLTVFSFLQLSKLKQDVLLSVTDASSISAIIINEAYFVDAIVIIIEFTEYLWEVISYRCTDHFTDAVFIITILIF